MIDSSWMDAPLWAAAGRTMAHMLWLGVAVGLMGMGLRRILRDHPPEIRHNVALGLLVLLGLAPAVIGPWVYEPGFRSEGRPAAIATGAGAIAPTSPPVPSAIVSAFAGPRPIQVSTVPYDWMDRALRLLPIAWALGTSATLVLLSAGWIGVERLRRLSVPVESGRVMEMCHHLSATLGLSRRACVAVCDRLASPVLIGLVRPLILLPPAALSGWTPEELELVLLHELAHLRRHDHVVIVLQRGIEAFLFFQPAVWWLSSWLRLERELCCDRVVVTRTGRPRAYAEFLARLAGVPRPSLSLAFNDRSLSTRIARILNLNPPSRRPPRMRPTLPEGLGTLALIAALATLPLYATVRAQGPGAMDEAKTKPDVGKIREYLRKIASEIDLNAKRDLDEDHRVSALTSLAKVQLKAGDRDGAVESVSRAAALVRATPINELAPDVIVREFFHVIDAHVSLGQNPDAIEMLKLFVDRGLRLIEARRVDGKTGALRTEEEQSASRASLLYHAAYWAIDHGDKETARPWIRQLQQIKMPEKSNDRFDLQASLAECLAHLGESTEVRRCLDDMKTMASREKDSRQRQRMEGINSLALAVTLGWDEAVRYIQALAPSSQFDAFNWLLRLHVQDRLRFDTVRIKIGTGGEVYDVKKPEALRAILPIVARGVRESKLDELRKSRLLAKIAELQARAGDVAGGVATANGLPDNLKRSDFPGPIDSHCDAIKPIALSALAVYQADIKDQAGACASLDKARALVATITDEEQKVVAILAVARGLGKVREAERAKAFLKESLPILDAQKEPRRSRALFMWAEVQVALGDFGEAARVVEMTREREGAERESGYRVLERAARQAGDLEAARGWLRKVAEHCEMRASLPPARDDERKLIRTPYMAESYLPSDAEVPVSFLPNWKNTAIAMRYELDDAEAVLKMVRSLPANDRHDVTRQILARRLAQGDFDGAQRVLNLIEDKDRRVPIYQWSGMIVDGLLR